MKLDANKIIALLVAAILAGCGWYLRENAREMRELRLVVAEAQKDLAVTRGAFETYLRSLPGPAPATEEEER